MSETEARLERLERIVAEQERTIEDLSGEIAEQWKVIEGLRRQYDTLRERFLSLEEQVAPEVPVTRPPHW